MNTIPDYMGYKYNVLIEGETGERTWEPTNLMLDMDERIRWNWLFMREKTDCLELPGWKQCEKRLAKRKKKLDQYDQPSEIEVV